MSQEDEDNEFAMNNDEMLDFFGVSYEEYEK